MRVEIEKAEQVADIATTGDAIGHVSGAGYSMSSVYEGERRRASRSESTRQWHGGISNYPNRIPVGLVAAATRRAGRTLGPVDGVLGGRYELGALLGRGATSSVYTARDQRLDRTVAVKVLRSGLSSEGRQRFVREARASARVSHPNVVVVYDAGVHAGRPYLAMELVEGGDLASVLAARAPLPVVECVEIADEMLAALAALHDAGIVHRDVKPANVLLTGVGEVKLTDFGIARLDDSATLTLAGSVLGTPAYLPPEQAQGERPSPVGDLYSVGAICFEMLTGSPPFGTGPATSVALAHVSAPLPSLRQRRPDTPVPVAAVVERALAKLPSDRWPTARVMRSELVSAMGVDPDAETKALYRAAPTERFGTVVLPRAPVPVPPTPPAALPEREAPPFPGPGRSASWRRLALAGGGAAVLLALAIAAAARLGKGDGDGVGLLTTDRTAATTASSPAASTTAVATTPPPQTTTAPATTTTNPPTTTVPPTTVPLAEPTIESVVATLGADPSSYGEKGVDLRDRLHELGGLDGRDQRAKARDTIKDIDDWLDDGLLDEAIAQAAVAALEPIARQGNGDEDDD